MRNKDVVIAAVILSTALILSCLIFLFPATEKPNALVNSPSEVCPSIYTDKRDGEQYLTGFINKRCWILENMRFSNQNHFTETVNTNTSEDPMLGAYAKNDFVDSFCLNGDCSKGHLYPLREVFAEGKEERNYNRVCPEGFTIPTEADVRDLERSTKKSLFSFEYSEYSPYDIWTWLYEYDKEMDLLYAKVYKPGEVDIEKRLGYTVAENKYYVKCLSEE